MCYCGSGVMCCCLPHVGSLGGVSREVVLGMCRGNSAVLRCVWRLMAGRFLDLVHILAVFVTLGLWLSAVFCVARCPKSFANHGCSSVSSPIKEERSASKRCHGVGGGSCPPAYNGRKSLLFVGCFRCVFFVQNPLSVASLPIAICVGLGGF